MLQEFKLHPLVRRILAGGKRVAWGAKAIPEGGYWAMPRLHAPGMVICGDGGGMVNVPKLKGIHYAIRSGMLAAETLYERLKSGSTDFSSYERAVHDSEIGKDLYESRNMKQPFARGLIVGGAISNAMVVTKGRLPGGHWPTHRDADQPLMLTDRDKRYPKPDGKYTFDKLSSVFATGNATRDDAPSHIRIQQRVPRELAEAWAWMCPAAVYEVPGGRAAGRRARRPAREPVELRAVRRDHRQGRAPDAARGRRRARLPGDLKRRPQARQDADLARCRNSRRRALNRRRCDAPCSCSACCSCSASRPAPRRRRASKLLACVRRARGAGALGHLRGARAPRRAAACGCRCASRCRSRDAALPGWRRVVAAGLDEWLDVRRRACAATSTRKTVREPLRAGRLPDGRALPLARLRTERCWRARARRRGPAASPTCART